MFIIKRIYEPASTGDGRRYLVDRLWPRGVSKEKARLDGWLKELAPSTELRRWFNHEPGKWEEFRERYRGELSRPELARGLAELRGQAMHGPVTLLHAARDEERNNAAALRQVLEEGAPKG